MEDTSWIYLLKMYLLYILFLYLCICLTGRMPGNVGGRTNAGSAAFFSWMFAGQYMGVGGT